jgi:hypothetical protein
MSRTATVPRAAAAAKKTTPARPRKTAPPPEPVEAAEAAEIDQVDQVALDALVEFDDDDFAESEQVFIFELGGVKYYAPTKPAAGVALGYLRYMRRNREDLAYAWIVEQMCGEEAYEALCSHPQLRETGFAKVVAACQQLLKVGPGPKASARSPRSGGARRAG